MSAYTDGDMYAYNDALLEIMTHHNAMKNEREDGYAEGKAKGREEGRAEGAKAQALETARRMKAKGLDIETILELTGLTPDEFRNL